MGFGLTEKIDKTTGLALKIKSTPTPKPLFTVRLDTRSKHFTEALFSRPILLRNETDETPFYRNQLYLGKGPL
jgi:hypothetical protein